MDSMLRIQVRVVAREAAKELQAVANGIRAVQRAADRSGGGMGAVSTSIAAGTREAQQFNAQLALISRNLQNIGKKPWQAASPGGTPGLDRQRQQAMAEQAREQAQLAREAAQVAKQEAQARQRALNSAWRQQTADARAAAQAQQRALGSAWRQQTADARAAAKAQADAQRAAAKQVRDEQLATQRVMKQVWRQQVADARASAQAQAQAQRQAAQVARQEAQARQRALGSAWRQQTAEARAAAKAEADAQRAAAKLVRDEKLATQRVMKQVWRQQVADAKAAARAEAQAQREAARAAQQAALQQQRLMSQVWRQQVRDAQNYNRTYQQLARERTRAAIDAAKKEATAKKMIADAEHMKDPFVGRLANLDRRINGIVDHTRQGMLQFGKNMQWVGRQINFNFTLPLAAAAGAVMNLELANERAFTRLEKVYGDGGEAMVGELDRIRHAMRLLSDMYGVQQAEVMELGARWAAAGAQGADLARSVETSLRLSILGDYQDLGRVFEDLIVIQGAFRLSSEELATAIAQLNTVENMTAATLPDLIDAMARAGGSAASAGVDIAHLAAMTAALVPATGSAANAGNALKTILSRIVAPTNDTIEVLRMVGIEFNSVGFQALNGAERLELIAEKFTTLSDAQQAYISSVVGSRWQVNKFSVLMADLADATGNYNKVLEELRPENYAKNWERANREIQTLLESSPQRIQILKTQMQNMLADAIQPLIPALIGFMTLVMKVVGVFTSLNPKIQVAIFLFLGLVAAVGVLAQAFGSIQLLVAQAGQFMLGTLRMLGIGTVKATATTEIMVARSAAVMAASNAAAIEGMMATMAAANTATTQSSNTMIASMAKVSAASEAAQQLAVGNAAKTSKLAVLAAKAGKIGLIAAAVAAIAALAYKFREQIASAFKSIWEWATPARNFIANVFNNMSEVMSRAFNALPESVRNAFTAVIRIIAAAVGVIREWLSWLNPFARHSPSLVDNVKAGVAVIAAEYAKLANSMSILSKAKDDLRGFMDATEAARNAARGAERSDQRRQIVAASPNAGPWVDALYSDLDALYGELDRVSEAIDAQEAIVAPLRIAYQDADNAVKSFEASMGPLRVEVENLEKQMAAAQSEIDRFASTPIAGMKAMNDAIFENEMAQKRLRYELLKMEQAGQSYESLSQRIANINGDLETARGEMNSLRDAGAGSDVLAAYQEQVNALESQKRGLQDAAQGSLDLQKQLEELQKAGELLDLEKSLKYDELLKQINDLANAQEELPFDEIIAGITTQKAKLDELTAAYEPQKAALDEQQRQLDQLILTRDRLKAAYDIENTQLDILKDQYSTIEQQIRDIEQALSDAAKAAADLGFDFNFGGGGGGAGGGGVDFDTLGAGVFPDTPLPTFGEGLGLEEMIAGWEKSIKEMFGNWDILSGIKSAWNKMMGWLESNALPAFQAFWNGLQRVAADIWQRLGFDPSAVLPSLSAAFDTVVQFVQSNLIEPLGRIWDRIPFKEQVSNAFGWLVDTIPGWLGDAWDRISGFFGDVGSGLAGFAELWDPLVDALDHVKNVFLDVLGIIETGIKVAIAAATPLIAGLVVAFMALWNIVTKVVGPVFTQIGRIVKAGLDFIKNTVALVLAIINGDWGAAWNAIKGIFVAVWDAIVATFNATWATITGIMSGLAETVTSVFGFLRDRAIEIVVGLVNGVINGAIALANWFLGLKDQVLGWIGDAALWLVNKGLDIITGLWNGIEQKAVDVINWFRNLPRNIVNWIGSVVLTLKQKGIDFLTGLATGIAEKVLEIINWFQNLPNNVLNWIGSVVLTLKQKGIDFLTGLSIGLAEKVLDVRNWFAELPGKIPGYMGSALSVLYNWGKDLIQGLINGIENAAARLPGLIGGIVDRATPWDGWLPGFAKGGVVVSPTMAMIGEAGAEAVIPLTNATRALELMSKTGLLSLAARANYQPAQMGSLPTTTKATTLVFNGDLSFPNIETAGDAERFISNLEMLAGA